MKYHTLAFTQAGSISNWLNERPQYHAVSVSYRPEDSLFYLLYYETTQQPVDAVAFAEWLAENIDKGKIGPTSQRHRWLCYFKENAPVLTTADLYALFPGSQASNQREKQEKETDWAPTFNWRGKNDGPEIPGTYIVEVSGGDDEGKVVFYAFDEYKYGRWGYAQFLLRWLDISNSPEFGVINQMPREKHW